MLISLLSALAILSPLLDVSYTIGLMLILFFVVHKKGDRSLESTILLAIVLFALTHIGLPKVVVSSAVFILVGHLLRKNAIWNILVYTALGFVYFEYYGYMANLSWNTDYILFLALMGGLSASLIESVDVKDKEFVILLTVATVYTIFHIYAISIPMDQLAIAFAISFILSLLATKAGVADESGLMSATLIGTLTIVFSDIRFFVILLLFYAIGSAVTKYKYSIKLQRGIAEQAGGARGYANVFSNSLAGLFFVMNYGVFKEEIFLLAFVASIATALGDTMASEVGKTADRVYLITNFRRVEPGVSGGISLIGEIAALIGCLIVCSFAVLLGILDVKGALISFVSGFIAIHIDSLLGATLEKWGYLTNSGVNFFATLSAGVFCYLLAMMF
jgi:uncharacterized protein (TIGR00297 family)